MELRSFSHGYGQITYHIVLVPKYRYKIFYNRQVKKDCELILKNICMEQGYKIHAIEIVADHVHLFLEFNPSTSLSKVVQYLKGSSSHRLFKLHPELKKRYWGGRTQFDFLIYKFKLSYLSLSREFIHGRKTGNLYFNPLLSGSLCSSELEKRQVRRRKTTLSSPPNGPLPSKLIYTIGAFYVRPKGCSEYHG